MVFTYGVTTVRERDDTLLPKTLDSLAKAGFCHPHLFMDGSHECSQALHRGLSVTPRFPRVGVAGNWVLSLYELYYRTPLAEYFILFQDDIVVCNNLLEYLTRFRKKPQSYWNLYTSRSNEKIVPRASGVPQQGWYQSNQLGRGALGLMFDRETVVKLLSSEHMARRPQCPVRGNIGIDGGVVTALHEIGIREYVHYPSLIQHTGEQSTMGHSTQKFVQWSESFRGESYDPLELLAPSL